LVTRPGHLDSACRVSVRPCKMQQSSNSCSFVRRSSICSALPHLARNLCLLNESVCACKRRRYHNVARQPATNRASSSALRTANTSAVSASIALPSHRKREMDRRPHCHLRGASGNSACRATLRRAVDRSAAPLALGARRCAIPVSAPRLTCQMQRGRGGSATRRTSQRGGVIQTPASAVKFRPGGNMLRSIGTVVPYPATQRAQVRRRCRSRCRPRPRRPHR
jgi:hypothetical protein